MEQKIEELSNWLDNLKDFSLPSWDTLPEMELYMDQVMSYLAKKLEPIFDEDIEKTITPYMVNNYVKANLIDAPNHKKYSRPQIGYLLGICLVKQIISISDILLLYDLNKNTATDKSQLYEFFQRIQNNYLKEESSRISSRLNIVQKRFLDEIARAKNDEQREKATEFAEGNLGLIALRLAIEAEVKKIIADHILVGIKKEHTNKKAEKKENKIVKKAVKKEAKNDAKKIKIVKKKS